MRKLLVFLLSPFLCLGQDNRPGVVITQPGPVVYPFPGVSLSVSPSSLIVTNVTTFTVSAQAMPSSVTSYNIQWYTVGSQPGTVTFGSPLSSTTTVNVSANGTYTLAADINDGPRHVVSQFVAVVNAAVNTAPSITAVQNQTVAQDSSSSALAFTVGDPETSAGSLSVNASSSNTNLIDGTGIVLGGSGANRTVTLTPKALKNGTSTITLTVSDGGTPSLSTYTSFLLTVPATNYPPSFTSVPNPITSNEDVNFSFPVGIADTDTALANLTVTASSSAGFISSLVVSGSGATRTVAVNLVPNGFGTNLITVRLTDGQTIVQTNITVQVASVNDLPTISSVGPQQGIVGTNLVASFTVNDIEDGGSVTVTRATDNSTVLPLSAIALGGSGTSRTVTVTPQAVGVANCTLTVTDFNNATAQTSFSVTGVAAANNAPTITPPGAQSVFKNVATGNLAVTVGDVETPAANLILFAASSNPTLAPTNQITLGGSGANRTIKVTPTSNQVGTATIILTVQDGSGGQTSGSFVLTVLATNYPPTISSVSTPQTVSENGQITIAFSVADPDTALASLQMSASSANTTTVPNANIVFAGTGASRTATITPAANQYGTNNITFAVSDGTTSAQTTFSLQTTFVNQLPTITALSPVTMATNSTSPSQQFSVGDLETSANNLIVTASSSAPSVIPNGNIILGGGGQTRTVAITSGSAAGGATITVTVTDANNGSRSSSFGVTVNGGSGGGGGSVTGYFAAAPDSPIPGNDSNSGTNANAPWTLTKALSGGTVPSGKTVWVRRGTYKGSFSGSPNGIILRPFPGDEWWNGTAHVVIDRNLADCATDMNDTPAAFDTRNWVSTDVYDMELRNSVPRCELTSGENYQRPDLLGNINGAPHGNRFYHLFMRDGMNNNAWQFHVAGTGDELRGCISILGGTAASYEGGGMGGCFYAQNVSGGTPIRFTDNLMGEGFNRLGELNGTNPDGPQNNVIWDGNIGWGGGAPGCYAVGCSMGSGFIFGTFNNNQDITVINNIVYTWLQNKGNYSPSRSGGGTSFGVVNGTPFTHSNYLVSNNIVCGSFAFTLVNPVNSTYRNNTFISGIYEPARGSLGLASGNTISGNTYIKAASGDSVWTGNAPSESGATVLVGPPTQNVIRRKVVQHPTDTTNTVMNVTVMNWQGLNSILVDPGQDDYGTPFLPDGRNYIIICGLNPLVTYANGTKNGVIQIPVNTGFAPLDPVCSPFFSQPCQAVDQPYSPGTAGGGGHALTTLPEFLPLQIIRTN